VDKSKIKPFANLEGANLEGADLYRADLRSANLEGANLYRANLAESKGLNYAIVTFDDHGECGRMLTAALINRAAVYFCGCFSGTAEELQEYINKGDEQHKESRQKAFDFVKSCMS